MKGATHLFDRNEQTVRESRRLALRMVGFRATVAEIATIPSASEGHTSEYVPSGFIPFGTQDWLANNSNYELPKTPTSLSRVVNQIHGLTIRSVCHDGFNERKMRVGRSRLSSLPLSSRSFRPTRQARWGGVCYGKNEEREGRLER